MRYLFILIFYIFSCCALPIKLEAATRYQDWKTIFVNNISYFQIPSTMEVQSKEYQEKALQYSRMNNNKFDKKSLVTDENSVFCQQKGLNNISKDSIGLYARVMFKNIISEDDVYSLNDNIPNEFIQELSSEVEKNIYREAAQSNMKIAIKGRLHSKPININNMNGILVSYTRSLNDGPDAFVRIYFFFNKRIIHQMIVSYRIAHEKLWKKDLDKVINTLYIQPL